MSYLRVFRFIYGSGSNPDSSHFSPVVSVAKPLFLVQTDDLDPDPTNLDPDPTNQERKFRNIRITHNPPRYGTGTLTCPVSSVLLGGSSCCGEVGSTSSWSVAARVKARWDCDAAISPSSLKGSWSRVRSCGAAAAKFHSWSSVAPESILWKRTGCNKG